MFDMAKVLFFTFFIIFSIYFTKCSRILSILPMPFHSHQLAYQSITEELALQGNQLVVLTPLPHSKLVDEITQYYIKGDAYTKWDEGFKISADSRKTFAMSSMVKLWELLLEIMYPVMDLQFEYPKMQALIQDKTESFDLVILEGFEISSVCIRFNVPVIILSAVSLSTEYYTAVGAETNYYIYPDIFLSQAFNLTFIDKLTLLYDSVKIALFLNNLESRQNIFTRRHFGHNATAVKDLKKNTKMLLLNVHHMWEYNRPVVPGTVIYMGSVILEPPKVLPKDLLTYVDSSVHGVIVMTLGSKLRISTLPERILRIILDVFASLPYDVILKWELDEMRNKPSNVRIEKWLPLNDLLHHPKVKVFMTHGGLRSTDEAISAKVPLIALPIFGDQWLNALKYEKFGIGVRMNIDELGYYELRNAIIEVAEEKRYRENIARLSRIFADHRMNATQVASIVGHLRIKGSEHLKSPLIDVSFIEFYMLDLICFVLLIIICCLVTCILILQKIFKYVKTVILS